MDNRGCPVSWESDPLDVLVESEENTLRFRRAQTRRTVTPKPLPAVVSSVAVAFVVVVTGRFSGNEVASSANARSAKLTPNDRFSLTCRLRHPTRLMLSRVPKRGLSSLAATLKNNALIDVHPEVAEALHARKPVVALESTIITHGMPYPVNLETARSVERNIRVSGSVPATIGLIDGRVKIGLESYELERLAECSNEPVKISRRDIGAAIALRRDGGTTCSATLVFAALAGIKVRCNSIFPTPGFNLTFCRSSQREGTTFAYIETHI